MKLSQILESHRASHFGPDLNSLVRFRFHFSKFAGQTVNWPVRICGLESERAKRGGRERGRGETTSRHTREGFQEQT